MLLSTLPVLLGSSVANKPIKLSLEAETTASVVRSLSAVSLMFIIMVTPWAILQAGWLDINISKFRKTLRFVSCGLH